MTLPEVSVASRSPMDGAGRASTVLPFFIPLFFFASWLILTVSNGVEMLHQVWFEREPLLPL